MQNILGPIWATTSAGIKQQISHAPGFLTRRAYEQQAISLAYSHQL